MKTVFLYFYFIINKQFFMRALQLLIMTNPKDSDHTCTVEKTLVGNETDHVSIRIQEIYRKLLEKSARSNASGNLVLMHAFYEPLTLKDFLEWVEDLENPKGKHFVFYIEGIADRLPATDLYGAVML